MPGRRRRTAGRSFLSKSTKMRKMMYSTKKKNIKQMYSKYHFRRIVNLSNITGGISGAANFGTYTFSLDQLPNYTEFTNLFDQYRINKVVLKLIPQYNQSTFNVGHANNTATSGQLSGRNPRFMIVNDYDDDTAPVNMDTLRQYANVKVYPVMNNKLIKHTITPATQMMAYETIGTTGYIPKFKQWINCSDSNVPHYAIKWGIEDTSAINNTAASLANAQVYFRVEASIYLSFKGVI